MVGAARVAATTRYTGQDKYDHWGEADRLANRLMDALERHGASFEEIGGHEPNSVFNAYPPTSQ
ncbi:hypothetical protein SAZ11_08910 [Streptomyces sp. FXJ1.4098]|nr:hypothetical protein [Streptomyces sp. FXJ1.4098]